MSASEPKHLHFMPADETRVGWLMDQQRHHCLLPWQFGPEAQPASYWQASKHCTMRP